MGWSTTVVAPPDGNMADYMDSLEKVRKHGFETLWPTHGSPVQGQAFVNTFIEAYRDHRIAREAAIIEHLSRGETSIPAMVAVMYADVRKELHPAAAMSVLGHMMKLVHEGVVQTPDTTPTVRSQFQLKDRAA